MRYAGCRQLLIGFESPRPGDLQGLDPISWKHKQAPNYRRVIDTLPSRGISVNGCFILGLDSHTTDVFPAVLDFGRASGMAEVQYTVLTPFPGTPLYDRLKRDERMLKEKFWDACTLFDVTYQPNLMSVDELEAGLRWLFAESYPSGETKSRLRNYSQANSTSFVSFPRVLS